MAIIQTFGQIVLLVIIAAISNLAAGFFHSPLPGSILGLLMVFGLLKLGWLRLERIERGADFLLTHMLLFFIPSAVAVIQYREQLAAAGIYLLAIIVVSTVLVMMFTGLIAELLARRG